MKLQLTVIGILAILIALSCGDNSKKGTPVSKPEVKNSTADQKTTKNASDPVTTLTPQQKLGKRLFIMCEACHNVKEGEPHKVGPNLHKVFGRKAGTEPAFAYSEAILTTDITWSDETIREWLKNPNNYIPGTNMVFVGLPKEHQQDALLAYLHHVTE